MKLMQSCLRLMAAGFIVVVTSFLLISNLQGQETTATNDAARLRRAQLPFAKGTLLANDLLRRMLKLKTEDGTRTFYYTEHVYIFRSKEKITPDKLIIGEIIALRFDTDSEGRAVVRRIKAYGKSPPDASKSSEATESAK
jgi:hypothetical protein